MAEDSSTNICIPIHLDAFVLSPGSCDGPSSIAPYTQPNYTSLRLDSHLIQHDVLDHTDFHLNSPAWNNPRIADLGRSPGPNPTNSTFLNRRQNRMGVHLSWSLPRLYRSAAASGKRPSTSDKPVDAPNPNPVFPAIPNRWLVTRRIKDWSSSLPLKEWQSWVIESDAVQKITEITDPRIDIESETSPFVVYHNNPADINLFRSQTEVLIGQKFDFAGNDPWREAKAKDHIDNLTIMSSSNPLFADNALHNTNVLSMIDNFAYTDGNRIRYLETVRCDYFVLGWHADAKDDPFQKITPKGPRDLGSRLANMMLRLDEVKSKDSTIINDEHPRRCLLHGAIYDVKYDFRYDPNATPSGDSVRNIANESARKFTSQVKMEPLSIGTTPLDAMMTFMEAHKDETTSVFGNETTTKQTVELLLSISELLFTAGDNYDARVQAQDLLAQQNFSRIEGGLNWIFASTTEPGKPPLRPDDAVQARLVRLNEVQMRHDAATRKLHSLQWQLFAEWWKYASKSISPRASRVDIEDIRRPFRARVRTLANLVQQLKDHIDSLKSILANNISVPAYKQTTNEPYQSRVDPTLCIAGLAPGWPKNWQDALIVRLHTDLKQDDRAADTIFGTLPNPVPSDQSLDKVARRLLTECVFNSKTKNGRDTDAMTDGKYAAPSIDGFQQWGNRIPFMPLYIEWEGIYFHVGPMKDKWDVQLRPSPVGHRHPAVRYTPNEVLADNAENRKDFRTVSGRVLVLPQPVFSLQALVMQVLDDASAAENFGKDEAEIQKHKDLIKANIEKVQFVSAPLSGLTDHLVTRFEGSHVKPNVRTQGARESIALSAAILRDIGMDSRTLKLIESESDLTPYADSFPFNTSSYPGVPFKPVTHGQMILTKLNVIDKFGQAICMPRVLRRRRTPREIPTSNIYPCMSDSLSPDTAQVTGGPQFLNTVLPDPKPDPLIPGKWPPCQYMQLTPAINQDARINGSFLIRDTINLANKSFTPWREATDYDPMIWGWIIINYANNGLQLFLGDGTFYAEVRRGGVEGTNVGPKWLPYDRRQSGDDPQNAGEQQLLELLEKLRNPEYFQLFATMINGSIANMPFPPSEYSGYANAIVGKPLALVNVGWNLELAEPALKSQNGLGNNPTWEGEVNDDEANRKPTNPSDPQNQDDWNKRLEQWDREVRNDFNGSDISKYQFPLKIGDIERNYDGVVGYWLADNDQDKCTTHWQTVYTYFVLNWDNLPAGTVLNIPTTPTSRTYTVVTDDTLERIVNNFSVSTASIKSANSRIPEARPPSPTNNTFQHIQPSNFLQLSPFYLDPLIYTNAIDISLPPPTTPTVPTPGQSILADRTAKMTITPMLMDPYTAIHAYSPILPTRKLALPQFAVEAALRKMHAFFHLGPLLVTKDVPYGLAAAKALTTTSVPPTNSPPDIANTTTGVPTTVATTDNPATVRLPISGKKGTWHWFQPYVTDDDDDDDDVDAPGDGHETVDPTYVKLSVEEDPGTDKYVKGPYGFIEGFLELAGGLDGVKKGVLRSVDGALG